MSSNHRLALGTVQFGMPYGIANQSGQVRPAEVSALLDCAAARGLDTLDTAIAYGESESRLGRAGVRNWKIVSKLPVMPEGTIDVAAWANRLVDGSLERLRIPRLASLLLHSSRQLSGPHGPALYEALCALKARGAVEKIGVSIYDPEELDAIWTQFRPDVVQAPFNVIDRRLVTSGWLDRLNAAGVEVHVRSVFLQGLLLMDASARPAFFDRWGSIWDEWACWLKESKTTPLQACLSLALSKSGVNRVIVGVDSLGQLLEIIATAEAVGLLAPMSLASDDPELINPSKWSLR
jgi:aryl-alcohol dehydrogenase-like predicted oxidoreductase